MSKLNLSVNLTTYSDRRPSNAPSLSNFKWNRAISGIDAQNPVSQSATLAVSESVTLFSGAAVKKFMYLETDGELAVAINGADPILIKPVVINDSTFPGILMLTSDITSLEVTNPSADEEVAIFVATVE